MSWFLYSTITVLGAIAALVCGPVKHQAAVLGLTRPLETWENLHGLENRVIPDTIACEDVHYHPSSGMLYSACQGDIEQTSGWMPGADALEHPEKPGHGTIVVIDPKTLKSQKLSLINFKGSFSTHGISIYSPPSDPMIVYIFAVNHVPNPLWTAESVTEEKAASRIELFVHTVGSKTAKYVRTIAHPLIRTPNDILALSESEFLVTNDHYYREGVMRKIETLIVHPFQSWTDTVHVRFNPNSIDGDVDAAVALSTVSTNNGLAWGPDEQVLIGDAAGGHIYFANLVEPWAGPGTEVNRTISISHRVSIPVIVDNPSYFSDPYAGVDGKDYSGYVMGGFARAVDFIKDFKDPTGQALIPGHVWYLPAVAGQDKSLDGTKLRKLIFSDNGTTARGATTSVIVAIDPAVNEGKREGWLFVTSSISPHMLATRINFETTLA